MNHVYRLVWSHRHSKFVVAHEKTRTSGRASSKVCSSVASVLLSGLLMASSAWAAPPTANALPTGAQVTAGTAAISTSGNTMNVQQSTQRAAINWTNFSIGSNATVNFQQPNASAVVLNRVVGNEQSVINGALNANGQVFVLNSNGVLFGQGAQVNVGGLVASTLNISDADFMAGRSTFERTGSQASVVNLGTINAADGGYVALMGNQVSNQGIISARLGTAALAAGDKISLNFNGNSLVGVTIDQGTLNSLVENKQAIHADGGLVVLTAKGLDTVLGSLVNNTGEIRAQTIGSSEGKIYLLGDMDSGTVKVDGVLDASAPNGGNGGFVETSAAHVKVADAARVTTLATNGQAGTWLIDPNDFTVASSGGDMTGAAVGTALAGGNVTIQSSQGATSGNGDIFVNDGITWTSGSTLTLDAVRNIKINATIDASGGSGGVVTLKYGQGAVSASNTATYDFAMTATDFGGKINLQAGQKFNTKLGLDGATTNWTVITLLGSAGDESISTSNSLQGLNHSSKLAGNFVLGSDILAGSTSGWNSGEGFTPIGHLNPASANPVNQTGYAFSGKFDGLGHSINGLTVNKPVVWSSSPPNDFNGLFGVASSASFANLKVASASISGWDANGILIGIGYGVNVTNVLVSGTVNGHNRLGGLMGGAERDNTSNANRFSSINNVISAVDITGNDSLGGLIGSVQSSTVNHTTSSGTITSSAGFAGGLIGLADGYVSISDSNSSSSVLITGGPFAPGGGLIGLANRSTVNNSSSSGAVTSNAGMVGGLIGVADGDVAVSNSHSSSNVTTSSQDPFTGGLIGLMEKASTVSNSYATGTVSGYDSVGGLIGSTFSYDATGSQITDSYATGNVIGNSNVGGLVGTGQHLILTRTHYATGTVTGVSSVGGLVGGGDGDLQISNSYSTSNIIATGGSVGGLVGYIGNGAANRSITDSYATGNVTGDQATGGLVGDGYVNITRSYAMGNVSGGSKVGGLIGAAYWDSGEVIEKSFATGNVLATGDRAGGLVGHNELSLNDVFATGSVTGVNQVGGLVGKNDYGSLAQGYSTGLVTGSGSVGGLIGYSSGGSVTGGYWDVATSGLGASGQTGSSAGGTGTTTAELKNILTTATWDIVEDSSLSQVYPQLRWATSGLSAGNSVWVIGPVASSSGSGSGGNTQTSDVERQAANAINAPFSVTPPHFHFRKPEDKGEAKSFINVLTAPSNLSVAFSKEEPLAILSSPEVNEPTQTVTLSDAKKMLKPSASSSSAEGGGGTGGDREVRVPVSRNSLAEIVNGGVKLPTGVEQQLFVVKAN